MKEKYLFISLEERNGEYEYTHRCLLITRAQNINFATERYASTFWGWSSGHDTPYWLFEGGARMLKVDYVRELTKEQYDMLNELFYQ